MTPSVMIRLALESRPRVLVDALDEREFARLLDWLSAHPELLALIDAAYDVERRAA
jgi:hypothetical protein